VRRAALTLLAAALLAAGCGGGSDEEAGDLLERGFATDVRSGVLSVEAEVRLSGIAAVAGPLQLTMEGPFEGGGPTELPDMEMDVRVSGMGQDFAGRALLTQENLWVEYGRTTYEAGEELWAEVRRAIEQQGAGRPRTFAEAGADPLAWVEDLETEGGEEVAGAQTTKVTGTVDVEAMLRDVNRLSPDRQVPESALRGVEDLLHDVEFEAWIGEDDIWRRISAESEFEVPEEERDSAGGLSGGRISFEMELDDPNEPVEIEEPAEARPIDELLRRLGIPPESLLGPGFATPTPG
jgi:hypothetical protein